MQLHKEFDVDCPTEEVASVLARDETLTGLFPDADTEVIDREGSRRTTRSHYRILGREGDATFHFTFEDSGDVRFEKVCDGNVWKKLTGRVTVRERRGLTRVRIDMEGRTKGFVPEFTIKLPMQSQLEEMARGLRARIEARA